MRPKPGIKLKITNMRQDPNNEGVAGRYSIDDCVNTCGQSCKDPTTSHA